MQNRKPGGPDKSPYSLHVNVPKDERHVRDTEYEESSHRGAPPLRPPRHALSPTSARRLAGKFQRSISAIDFATLFTSRLAVSFASQRQARHCPGAGSGISRLKVGAHAKRRAASASRFPHVDRTPCAAGRRKEPAPEIAAPLAAGERLFGDRGFGLSEVAAH